MQTVKGRWFGAGHSAAPDSVKAGAEAVATALGGRTAKAVFVFCSTGHDLTALLAAVRSEAGPAAEIIGCTTLGELSSTGGATLGSVAVIALGGDGFTVRTRAAQVGAHGHRAAGADVAAAMTGMDRPYTTLMLLCDGLTGDPHEVVRGAYSVLGAAVPLVGGFSGDDHGSRRSFQFQGDQVLSGAVVGIALGSDAPLGVGIAHGWQRTEPAMVATRSDGGRVFELDGEPALDVLLRRRGAATAADLFEGDASLLALGLSRRNGEDIRVLHGGDENDRSLLASAPVPQEAVCWLMDSEYQAMIGGAAQSCAQAVDALGGAAPLGVFTFDCGGRRGELGPDGTREEVAAIRGVVGGAVPFGGFYTMGEVARVRGSSGAHALTLVTLALA
ncbi:FIST signal transduction protein [Actinoplanes sp. NPDC049599]|uniref:FIST signal transduction protein n=1 Tax=Actinoplanes sp. NPDC049599 TaxID=3363903 RepID=UPI00378C07C4